MYLLPMDKMLSTLISAIVPNLFKKDFHPIHSQPWSIVWMNECWVVCDQHSLTAHLLNVDYPIIGPLSTIVNII